MKERTSMRLTRMGLMCVRFSEHTREWNCCDQHDARFQAKHIDFFLFFFFVLAIAIDKQMKRIQICIRMVSLWVCRCLDWFYVCVCYFKDRMIDILLRRRSTEIDPVFCINNVRRLTERCEFRGVFHVIDTIYALWIRYQYESDSSSIFWLRKSTRIYLTVSLLLTSILKCKFQKKTIFFSSNLVHVNPELCHRKAWTILALTFSFTRWIWSKTSKKNSTK